MGDRSTGRWLALMLLVSVPMVAGCGPPRSLPQPNPVRGYQLEISGPDGRFQAIQIGPQGEGCEVFVPDHDLNRICLIATNDNPTVIGGEAYGALNDRHTVALDALIWRARSLPDVSVCARGGLQAEFLAMCEQAAQAADYDYQGRSVRVRVPIGGAEPEATTSTGQ